MEMDEESLLFESRLDSQSQKLDHLETQMRDLTQVVCSMVETLKKSIEKMSNSNKNQGSHNEPPFQQSLLQLDRRMKLLLNKNVKQSVSTNLGELTKSKGEGEIVDVSSKGMQEEVSDFIKGESKEVVTVSKQSSQLTILTYRLMVTPPQPRMHRLLTLNDNFTDYSHKESGFWSVDKLFDESPGLRQPCKLVFAKYYEVWYGVWGRKPPKPPDYTCFLLLQPSSNTTMDHTIMVKHPGNLNLHIAWHHLCGLQLSKAHKPPFYSFLFWSDSLMIVSNTICGCQTELVNQGLHIPSHLISLYFKYSVLGFACKLLQENFEPKLISSSSLMSRYAHNRACSIKTIFVGEKKIRRVVTETNFETDEPEQFLRTKVSVLYYDCSCVLTMVMGFYPWLTNMDVLDGSSTGGLLTCAFLMKIRGLNLFTNMIHITSVFGCTIIDSLPIGYRVESTFIKKFGREGHRTIVMVNDLLAMIIEVLSGVLKSIRGDVAAKVGYPAPKVMGTSATGVNRLINITYVKVELRNYRDNHNTDLMAFSLDLKAELGDLNQGVTLISECRAETSRGITNSVVLLTLQHFTTAADRVLTLGFRLMRGLIFHIHHTLEQPVTFFTIIKVAIFYVVITIKTLKDNLYRMTRNLTAEPNVVFTHQTEVLKKLREDGATNVYELKQEEHYSNKVTMRAEMEPFLNLLHVLLSKSNECKLTKKLPSSRAKGGFDAEDFGQKVCQQQGYGATSDIRFQKYQVSGLRTSLFSMGSVLIRNLLQSSLGKKGPMGFRPTRSKIEIIYIYLAY